MNATDYLAKQDSDTLYSLLAGWDRDLPRFRQLAQTSINASYWARRHQETLELCATVERILFNRSAPR